MTPAQIPDGGVIVGLPVEDIFDKLVGVAPVSVVIIGIAAVGAWAAVRFYRQGHDKGVETYKDGQDSHKR